MARGARRGVCAIGLGLIFTAAGAFVAEVGAAEVGAASPAERVSRLEADQAHVAVTSGYVTRAKIALERASKLRSSGDGASAAVAERSAGIWLDAAETLARSVDGETLAASLELGALDAGARVDRERTLLEEALGNAGRRRAELARLERERSSAAPRVRTADIDGGVGAPAKASSSSSVASTSSRIDRDGGSFELHMPGASGTPATSGAGKRRGSAPAEESPP